MTVFLTVDQFSAYFLNSILIAAFSVSIYEQLYIYTPSMYKKPESSTPSESTASVVRIYPPHDSVSSPLTKMFLLSLMTSALTSTPPVTAKSEEAAP